MYDDVLIPTDGSEHALRAAEHGRYLARAFDATVHVITVVDVQAAGGLFDAGGVDDEFVARLETAAENAIEAVEAVVGEAAPIRTAVLRGEPAEAILEYADDNGVDVLAMGTHGRTGVKRSLMGSVTEQVVRRSDAPVLTVRVTERTEAADYDEILVPTDGSDRAAAAVAHALAIAGKTDARVHALNVVDVSALTVNPEFTPPSELIERLESAGEAATQAITDRASAAGLDAVTEVREGFPSRELLAYVDENEVDLVAMGTAGRSGLDRYLLGSTTERVSRRAPVPVLAVNGGTR